MIVTTFVVSERKSSKLPEIVPRARGINDLSTANGKLSDRSHQYLLHSAWSKGTILAIESEMKQVQTCQGRIQLNFKLPSDLSHLLFALDLIFTITDLTNRSSPVSPAAHPALNEKEVTLVKLDRPLPVSTQDQRGRNCRVMW